VDVDERDGVSVWVPLHELVWVGLNDRVDEEVDVGVKLTENEHEGVSVLESVTVGV
jgi:hypothetical protein